MKKVLKFFGPWVNLSDFWREFFDNFFFKTAAYGCSGRLRGSSGEKSNCLIVFGLWAKVTVFWQKIYGRLLKVMFTCPQQNFEKKMIEVKYTIIIFLGFWMRFFLILTKKSNKVCRNSNLNVQKKNVIKKRSWTNDLLSFLDSTRKTCIFNGKFLAALSNLLFTCPEEHLQTNVSGRKSWKLKDFWINFEVFVDNSGNPFSGLSKQQ